MSDETTEPEAPAWDPRPPAQIEAEEGARDEQPESDPRWRAADIASSRAYAGDGIAGAPGSEADPGGDLPEPYPYEGVRPASQAEAEDAGGEATGEAAAGGEPEDSTGA